jgi:hypothetical protein
VLHQPSEPAGKIKWLPVPRFPLGPPRSSRPHPFQLRQAIGVGDQGTNHAVLSDLVSYRASTLAPNRWTCASEFLSWMITNPLAIQFSRAVEKQASLSTIEPEFDLSRLDSDENVAGVWIGTANSIREAVETIRILAATKPGKIHGEFADGWLENNLSSHERHRHFAKRSRSDDVGPLRLIARQV